MIRIMHVLCTGSNCIAKDSFRLTMVRWIIQVFNLLLLLLFSAEPSVSC